VPLRATKNIGVTVWNSDGTPYRIAFDSGNLGKFLDKLVPDPLEGVLVSEAKHPYLSGIAKVAFASNASNCGDFQPRYIEFSIEDGRAISSYISNSNSTIKLIMDKYNNELSDVNRSMEFYDNLKSVISENASEQAKHVDIDSVKFDELMTNTLSSMSVRKCSSNGFVAVQEPEYTPEGNNPYAEWFVSRAAGSSKGDWVSDASLTDLESGETMVYGGPVNQYVLGAFSSAVVARTLAERYGIEYRDAQ
jgi:hypothetical protein